MARYLRGWLALRPRNVDPLDTDSVDTGERLQAALAGQYVIEREIGRGGMGAVYRARDLRHRRSVALKFLAPEFSQSLGADRFLREIEVAAGLAHPHTVALHDSGEADGLLYPALGFPSPTAP